MTQRRRHIQTGGGRRGFTLIELMVVIGVILLLVALTVAVGTGLLQRSEISETQNTMRLLDMAVYEWEQSYDRQVTFGINGQPCNDPGRPEVYELDQQVGAGGSVTDDMALEVTDQLWEIFSRSAPVRDLIAQVNPAFVTELAPDGKDFPKHLEQRSFRIFDAWDKEILAILPGRSYSRRCNDTDYNIDADSGRTSDIDGTIRTPFENHFGTAADRRIFFVSAGPDGTFGALRLDLEQSELGEMEQRRIREASDNVYSYPVYTEEARK